MKIIQIALKFIFLFAFLFTASNSDAQFTRTTVLLGGGTQTGTNPEPALYFFEFIVEFSNGESPCDAYIGITLEESTSQITYYFPVPDIGGDVSVTSTDINNVIFDELCLSGYAGNLHFVFDLYCHDGNGVYTEIDPCAVEMIPHFRQNDACDLSMTEEIEISCSMYTYTTGVGDAFEISENINQENIQLSTIQLQKRIKNTTSLINYHYNNDFIALENLSNSSINFQIMTISGQIVQQGRLSDKELEKQIDTSNLNHGLYIITYGNKDNIVSKKFVK